MSNNYLHMADHGGKAPGLCICRSHRQPRALQSPSLQVIKTACLWLRRARACSHQSQPFAPRSKARNVTNTFLHYGSPPLGAVKTGSVRPATQGMLGWSSSGFCVQHSKKHGAKFVHRVWCAAQAHEDQPYINYFGHRCVQLAGTPTLNKKHCSGLCLGHKGQCQTSFALRALSTCLCVKLHLSASRARELKHRFR